MPKVHLYYTFLGGLHQYLRCAIELHEKLANEVTGLHSLDLRNYLFNGQEEGDECYDFHFEQGFINEASSVPGQLALPTLSDLKRLRKKRVVWVLIIEKL